MVFGFFKKKEDKQAAQPKPQANASQEQELERQRKLVEMQKRLEIMKEKIDAGYEQVENRREKIKDLVRNKKKVEAKRQLQVLKTLQEELAKQENMCIILEKMKIQLDVASETQKMVEVFKDASNMMKESEKNVEFLEDFLLDQKEMNEKSKEVGNLLNEIAQGDQEEIDEIDGMFAEMEKEVMDDQMSAINDKPLKNVTKNQPQVVAQTSSNASKQTQQDSAVDDILSMASQYN